MSVSSFLQPAGVALLIAAAFAASRGGRAPRLRFWGGMAIGLTGAVLGAGSSLDTGWNAGFATALWLIVLSALAVFATAAGFSPPARRLGPLLMPYFVLLAVLALIWRGQGTPLSEDGLADPWLLAHVPAALLAYAFVTLGAAAALAVLLREAAVKRKKPMGFTSQLPSIAECERLELRFLLLAGAMMGLGLATGMAANYGESGRLFDLDHKTLLSLVGFVLLTALILLHFAAGVRGRLAARLLLAAYLILTLAYPGVKFVFDVVIGTGSN